MNGPEYDLLLVAHVASGVVGFGAIGVAGWTASMARKADDPASDARILRFFRPGRDWPARAIFLVPIIGLAMLFGGDRSDAHAIWPWIGLGIWVAVAGLATGLSWPAERDAQGALAEMQGGGEAGEILGGFRDACRRMERAALMISLCFVIAVAVMIVQP